MRSPAILWTLCLALLVSSASSQTDVPSVTPSENQVPVTPTPMTGTPTPPTSSAPTITITSVAPTISPLVPVITGAPSLSPSISDTPGPTVPGSVSPTVPDSLSPTVPDSLSPTVPDSLSPTVPGSLSPTVPDATETLVPTNSTLSEPSGAPSDNGSGAPSGTLSLVPTTVSTPIPTFPLLEEMVENLAMTMFGITELPTEDYEAWESATKGYLETYYFSIVDLFVSPLADFTTNVTIQAVIIPQPPATGGRQLRQERNLQGGGDEDFVSVVYSQTMEYRFVALEGPDPTAVATAPFETQFGRDGYMEGLRGTDQGVLTQITSTSAVFEVESGATSSPTLPPVPAPTTSPTTPAPTTSPTTPEEPPTPTAPTPTPEDNNDDPALSTGAIIGVAVGGGIALIAMLLLFFFRSGDNDYEGANDPPPSVNVKRGGDEVSTLAPPVGYNKTAGNESIAGFGDQSVATVDYDYSKAYGGGGDTSVSSAGGTFGSQTHGQSVLDPATAGATGAALGAAVGGSFSDADSFEHAYRDPNANVKEELLNIFAPPGKLGVVIDTPDDGAPVVHAVKDSSVIADKILVGDKLVAVDDEDVRSMTAIKVSKLISRKSANPSRKLSIIRMTVIE